MDINKDIADPNDEIRRFEDGKYLYRSNSDDFDVDRFNLFYEQYRDKRKKIMRQKMEDKLERLNAPVPEIPIYRQSIGHIMISTKDALFETLDDILQGELTWSVFMKHNRLFHLGLILVIIAMIIYLYTIIIGGMYDHERNRSDLNITHLHEFLNARDNRLVLAEIKNN